MLIKGRKTASGLIGNKWAPNMCATFSRLKILQSYLDPLYFIRRGSRSIYIYLYIFTGSSLKMNRSFRRRFALLGACCKYIIYIPLYILVLLFTHIHTGCFLRVLIKKQLVQTGLIQSGLFKDRLYSISSR